MTKKGNSERNVVVIGASPNATRYSFMATERLLNHGYTVFPIGLREGKIEGLDIITSRPQVSDIDTVTLYVGPQNQPAWEDYIISLKPQRVIFNPGTENHAFESKLQANGIEAEEACTLVLLSLGEF